MAWDYAELSKLAKANGGPEKPVEMLVNSGKKGIMPWVGVAFVGGVTLTFGVQKIVKQFAKKSTQSKEAVEGAKNTLIQGIKDYDAAQSYEDESLFDGQIETENTDEDEDVWLYSRDLCCIVPQYENEKR